MTEEHDHLTADIKPPGECPRCDRNRTAAGRHCPGCRGYTADWAYPCPGLPAPEAAPPARAPLDLAGHAVWSGPVQLPGLTCHCRIGKPHDVTDRAGYDQEHEHARADGAGPARPRP